jgi:hypothetical protein
MLPASDNFLHDVSPLKSFSATERAPPLHKQESCECTAKAFPGVRVRAGAEIDGTCMNGWLLAVGATHHLAHTCTLVRLTPVESSVVSPVLFNYLQILVSAVLFIWLKLFRQFVIFVGWARG